jgi:hypothetical protein
VLSVVLVRKDRKRIQGTPAVKLGGSWSGVHQKAVLERGANPAGSSRLSRKIDDRG